MAGKLMRDLNHYLVKICSQQVEPIFVSLSIFAQRSLTTPKPDQRLTKIYSISNTLLLEAKLYPFIQLSL